MVKLLFLVVVNGLILRSIALAMRLEG